MRKSKYIVSDKDFIEAVKNSFTIAQALRSLGYSIFGAAQKFFKKRVKELNLDTSHFTGQGHLKGKTNSHVKKRPLDQILIKNSNLVFRSSTKRRLIKEGLLEEKCYECGLGPSWNGKVIVLQIDHINGDCFDHRIENLRFLCPNCHSQTTTFCSRYPKNMSKTQRVCGVAPPTREYIRYFCCLCNQETKKKSSKYCGKCYAIHRKELQTYEHPTKIIWPSNEELLARLATSNYLQLSKELGVSDNAIRKHLKEK
jgi:hypothetical protein